MKKIIPFPQKHQKEDPGRAAMRAIEKRFGVSFWEYMDIPAGKRTPEVEEKIQRALRKETLQMATKIAEEDSHKENS